MVKKMGFDLLRKTDIKRNPPRRVSNRSKKETSKLKIRTRKTTRAIRGSARVSLYNIMPFLHFTTTALLFKARRDPTNYLHLDIVCPHSQP
jgi:hypothetical protein